MRIAAGLFLVLVAFSPASGAGTNYVWRGGSQTPPYDTWATAATNVDVAVAYAQASGGAYDTVEVTNGTYVITNQIVIAAALTVRGVSRDGVVVRRSVTGDNTPQHRIFRVNHAGAVLESLTVAHGHCANADGNVGGGVRLDSGWMINCVVTNGYGVGGHQGVGVYLGGAGAVVSNCVMIRNGADWNASGGGVYVNAGALVTHTILRGSYHAGTGNGGLTGGGAYVNGGTVRWCSIFGNTTANPGSGVFLANNAAGLVESCVISGNWGNNGSAIDGGGIYCAGAGTVRNCLIAGNASPRHGGGMATAAGAVVESCTIAGNIAVGSGGGVYSSGCAFTNCAIGANTAATLPDVRTNSGRFAHCLAPVELPGPSNIVDSPCFVNPAARDYRLAGQSRGIDGGAVAGWMADATDLDGNARIQLGAPDIGAYEVGAALRCAFTADVVRGLAPVVVTLGAGASGVDLSGLGYRWDFDGNGSVDAEGPDQATGTYTYAAGTYRPVLMVTNAAGETAVYTGIVAIIAAPDVVYVATNGSHTAPFDTWATAATNLQAALGAAAAGTRIVVTNGTYQLADPVVVDIDVTLESVNGAAVTKLRRNVSQASTPYFRVLKLIAAGAVVRGFTLDNGYAYEYPAFPPYENSLGGGAYMTGGTLEGCVISNCYAVGKSAMGLYLGGGLVTNCQVVRCRNDWGASGIGAFVAGGLLTDSRIAGNFHGGGNAASGGGVYQTGGVLRRCRIDANSASYGGGLYQAGGLAESCFITNNTAKDTNNGQGGGVRLTGGTLRNSLVARNVSQRTTAGAGGGVHQSGGLVESCTILENAAAGSTGGGLYATAGQMLNSISYFNTSGAGVDNAALSGTATVSNSCVTPLVTGGGNTSGAPGFTDRGSLNCTLLAGSPCLDAGTNQAWMAGATDLAGLDRVANDTVDMGAYERAFSLACNFEAAPLSGLAPLAVTLTALVGGAPDPAVLTYRWDFENDGAWDAEGVGLAAVDHAYDAGAFFVRLDVTDGSQTASYTNLAPIVAAPQTMYVATNGAHVAPYADWATAATNLAGPLALAADGVTILVSNGLYRVGAQTELAQGITIRAVNGAGTVRFERNTANPGDAPQFRIFKLTHTNAVLDGLTIARGYPYEWLLAGPSSQGGGVWMSGGTVRHCTVTDCYGSGGSQGVGLYLSGGVVTNTVIMRNRNDWGVSGVGAYVAGGLLTDSRVTQNFHDNGNTGDGAGVYQTGGTVRRCAIYGNWLGSSGAGGGGLFMGGGLAESCIVSNNSAGGNSGRGGGVYVAGGSLRNSLVVRNVAQRNAADAGGGIHTSGGSVENCTVVTNRAADPAGGAGGLFVTGTAQVMNSIVALNAAGNGSNDTVVAGGAGLSYSCTTPLAAGEGNTAQDPGFVSPAEGDWTLAEGSPCLDTGLNQPWMATGADLAGGARRVNGRVDMGCHERQFAFGSLLIVQ